MSEQSWKELCDLEEKHTALVGTSYEEQTSRCQKCGKEVAVPAGLLYDVIYCSIDCMLKR